MKAIIGKKAVYRVYIERFTRRDVNKGTGL